MITSALKSSEITKDTLVESLNHGTSDDEIVQMVADKIRENLSRPIEKKRREDTVETKKQKRELIDLEELSVDLWIDPGKATSTDILELFESLAELHRAVGGFGIKIRDDSTKVY